MTPEAINNINKRRSEMNANSQNGDKKQLVEIKREVQNIILRRTRIVRGVATEKDFQDENIYSSDDPKIEQIINQFIFVKNDTEQEIASNTNTIKFWVKFWSILSIIGFIISLILIISNSL